MKPRKNSQNCKRIEWDYHCYNPVKPWRIVANDEKSLKIKVRIHKKRCELCRKFDNGELNREKETVHVTRGNSHKVTKTTLFERQQLFMFSFKEDDTLEDIRHLFTHMECE